jgi:hypothetical protein
MAEALHAASAAPPAGVRDRAGSENGEIFVGRTAELAWMQERLDGTLAGAGGVVFVTGERGAGKSALVGEMLRRVRESPVPITVVAGRCLEHRGRAIRSSHFDASGACSARPAVEQAVEPSHLGADDRRADARSARGTRTDRSTARRRATRERLIREAGDFWRCRHAALPRRRCSRTCSGRTR